MTSYALVKTGSYRNNKIKNTIFPVLNNFSTGKKGTFLTVDGSSIFGPEFTKIRVTCNPGNVQFLEQDLFDRQCSDPDEYEGNALAVNIRHNR